MKMNEGLSKFNELIKAQFQYGGKKYALSSKKESTDELFAIHGKSWLFGTMHKYIFRLRNLERERDILKIATYCFILWLKKGFFVKNEGLATDILDTTIEIKEKQFPIFATNSKNKINDWLKSGDLVKFENRLDTQRLKFMEQIFTRWSQESWSSITEDSIIGVYYCCYFIWFAKYVNNKVHDQDINNPEDIKKLNETKK